MSIVTDYYNNEAVLSFTSETAFTMPSYNSRAVLTIVNLSAPTLVLTAYGSEVFSTGASTFNVGGLSTAKFVKGEVGWVVVEGSEGSISGVLTSTNTTVSTSTSTGAVIIGTNIGLGGTLGSASYFGGNLSAIGFVGPGTVTTATGVGLAFTNQPNNDGVEILSDSVADTTQTATVIGTTTGTNTVVVESVLLTGTTFVPTVKTDWGVILAVKLSASCAGTITFREASGNAAITTVTTGNTAKGVVTVSTTTAFNKFVTAVSDGSTTKQIGYKGTDSAGDVQYDSVALTGATPVQSNSRFLSLTEIYTGDVEVARSENVSTGKSGALFTGTATNDDPTAGDLGELLTAQLAVASTTSLTTATAKTIISKALTAGDWEVSGVVHFVPANTTTVTNLVAGISTATDTQPSSDLVGGYAQRGIPYTAAGTVWNSVVVPPYRISIGITTTYYLVATATFGASTCTGHGVIRARRVR